MSISSSMTSAHAASEMTDHPPYVMRCALRSMAHVVQAMAHLAVGNQEQSDKHMFAANAWAKCSQDAQRIQNEYNLPDAWFERVEQDVIDYFEGITN